MKVYVDELPKKCSDCPCFNWEERECLASEEDSIWLRNRIDAYRFRHNKCPLQSLTDHDKQIRKEVVQEIREKIIEEKADCEEALKDDFNFLGGKMMKLYCEEDLEVLNMVIDIINQIEGGENGSK